MTTENVRAGTLNTLADAIAIRGVFDRGRFARLERHLPLLRSGAELYLGEPFESAVRVETRHHEDTRRCLGLHPRDIFREGSPARNKERHSGDRGSNPP